ncbi:hypothetical protein EDD86DRAFT_245461 [Gorgonomyces haynaldii]|nr:hypothetical protein EDD86DRAFT_245461 [Gorgonomyces haynaldii]
MVHHDWNLLTRLVPAVNRHLLMKRQDMVSEIPKFQWTTTLKFQTDQALPVAPRDWVLGLPKEAYGAYLERMQSNLLLHLILKKDDKFVVQPWIRDLNDCLVTGQEKILPPSTDTFSIEISRQMQLKDCKLQLIWALAQTHEVVKQYRTIWSGLEEHIATQMERMIHFVPISSQMQPSLVSMVSELADKERYQAQEMHDICLAGLAVITDTRDNANFTDRIASHLLPDLMTKFSDALSSLEQAYSDALVACANNI